MKWFTCFSVLLVQAILVFGQQKPNNFDEAKIAIAGQKSATCHENPDSSYSRTKVLQQLVETLGSSIPDYKKHFKAGFYVRNEKARAFFVYDLTEPSNKDVFSDEKCIDFKNNHVYHFAPTEYRFSFSHIVVLEDGGLKIFKSINCKNSNDKIEDVVSYLSQKLVNDKNKNEIINRVRKYRDYGVYSTIDDFSLNCDEVKQSSSKEGYESTTGKSPSVKNGTHKCRENVDALYNRQSILEQFAEMLNAAAPGYKEYEKRGFYVENERPRKFFIYDLTDTSNKGMPLGDCVKLKNDHVYHVAPIYSPFSLSQIVILEDGNLKVFKSINCKNSKDSLEDVISVYLVGGGVYLVGVGRIYAEAGKI